MVIFPTLLLLLVAHIMILYPLTSKATSIDEQQQQLDQTSYLRKGKIKPIYSLHQVYKQNICVKKNCKYHQ
jgi:hypothetical protein